MLVTATGPASVEDAWQRYVLPALWPLWAPQIRAVRIATGTPDEPVVPGLRGTVLGPPPLRVPFRVLAVDGTERRWAWRAGLGPLGVTMEHGVDPDGPGCTAWVRIRLPGPLAAPYAPVARLALRRLVAG